MNDNIRELFKIVECYIFDEGYKPPSRWDAQAALQLLKEEMLKTKGPTP